MSDLKLLIISLVVFFVAILLGLFQIPGSNLLMMLGYTIELVNLILVFFNRAKFGRAWVFHLVMFYLLLTVFWRWMFWNGLEFLCLCDIALSIIYLCLRLSRKRSVAVVCGLLAAMAFCFVVDSPTLWRVKILPAKFSVEAYGSYAEVRDCSNWNFYAQMLYNRGRNTQALEALDNAIALSSMVGGPDCESVRQMLENNRDVILSGQGVWKDF